MPIIVFVGGQQSQKHVVMKLFWDRDFFSWNCEKNPIFPFGNRAKIQHQNDPRKITVTCSSSLSNVYTVHLVICAIPKSYDGKQCRADETAKLSSWYTSISFQYMISCLLLDARYISFSIACFLKIIQTKEVEVKFNRIILC